MQHYVDLLGKGGISGQAVNRLGGVLGSLVKFLASLKAILSTQSSGAASSGTQTHCWGLKDSNIKQVSVQVTLYVNVVSVHALILITPRYSLSLISFG